MNHIIVGTAGHIDHGKTALIEAINGYNGDETEEEKKRGITIDLSFSNISKNDKNIAFIDVPGHEKLLKNMISGAFGFDAVIFCIAANEGIMPQTIEHLEVLNFLNINNLIFVITKSDLSTADQIKKVKSEIEALVKEYKNLQISDILITSIKDKKSIDALKNYLFKLNENKKQKEENFFRYYIDRVFSVKGFGEVVTGTVLNGSINKDDKVLVSELSKEITVKNIEVHHQSVQSACKHQRAALNLNIPHGKLKKGYLLTTKGYFRGFDTIELFLKEASGKTVAHNQQVQFVCGSKSLTGKVHLYNEKIDNGYLAKITFNERVYLMHKDRFVLLSNGNVLGGGEVLDPLNDPIKKNKKIPLLKALKSGDYKEAFRQLCANHKKGFGIVSSIQRFALTHKEALEIANEIDDIFVDEKELVLYPIKTKEIVKEIIKNIYQKNRYAFLTPASLNLRLKWASVALIKSSLEDFVKDNFLKESSGIYKRVDIGEIDIEKELEKKLLEILQNEGFTPTAPYNLYDRLDIDRKLGDKTLKRLTASKKVVRIAHNLFITSQNLSKVVSLQKEIIKNEGYIDIKKFKEKLPISRKYLIGYLDYLDKFDDIKKVENRRSFR